MVNFLGIVIPLHVDKCLILVFPFCLIKLYFQINCIVTIIVLFFLCTSVCACIYLGHNYQLFSCFFKKKKKVSNTKVYLIKCLVSIWYLLKKKIK